MHPKVRRQDERPLRGPFVEYGVLLIGHKRCTLIGNSKLFGWRHEGRLNLLRPQLRLQLDQLLLANRPIRHRSCNALLKQQE